ncbi:MAG TPA: serine/threonine-protein kinase [Candidatus Angelobacter sp.]
MSATVLAVNLRFIQAGGYGNVFRADRSDNGGFVAVKLLREHRDPHARRVFSHQVRILARKIPGMVSLFGWDTKAEQPWYIMEYFRRGTLSQFAGRLDDTHLHKVALELAQHLSNIHNAVGTHGDIKPANIFVTDDGHLKFGDPSGNGLGLSMVFPQNEGGTAGYAAPEIVAGGPMSRAADVYALCATLYEMLTGRKPQKGQRIDPTAEGYTRAPKIREIIAAGCQPDPKARPNVVEIKRMLNGASWADILQTRKEVRGWIFGGVALVVAIFLIWKFSK